ncbi:MAG: GNAT family N-acetyltransferase [Alphaproteobacteria bacterium]
MTLSISACRPEDRDGVVALWRATFPGYTDDHAAQLALALANPSTGVYVARDEAGIAGTAMAGSDGIRGWLHYVAVAEDRRGRGIARALVAHCEAWLAGQRGVTKVHLQVRGDNAPVRGLYQRLGYALEDRASLGKRLAPPGGQPPPAPSSGTPGCLDVTVTHLEATSPPGPARLPAPALKLAMLRVDQISVPYFRYLYAEIGREWIWHERRLLDDATLAARFADPAIQVHVLHVDGEPGGYVEIDLRRLPDEAELAFFGLRTAITGRGIGRWLLDWSMREMWRSSPRRLCVNTCTLDHPAALPLYQKLGFRPFAQERRAILDPRPLH